MIVGNDNLQNVCPWTPKSSSTPGITIYMTGRRMKTEGLGNQQLNLQTN
jgi:hypothetical protein